MKKVFSLATIAIAVFALSACCGPWGWGPVGHGGSQGSHGGDQGGMQMQKGPNGH